MLSFAFFATIAAFIAHITAHGAPPSQEELLVRRELNEITGRSLHARCGAAFAKKRYAHMQKRMYLGLIPFNKHDANDSVCILTPEVTQGPYHILGELVRPNITGGQTGVPLELDLDFFDINTCEPVPRVWVDGWSVNATGIYSGYNKESAEADQANTTFTYSNVPTPTGTGAYTDADDPSEWDFSAPTDNDNFLRGVWQADERGHLKWHTIVPGWYSGRTAHFHIKVYTERNGSVARNGTFVAGSAVHTGQLFFPDDFYEKIVNMTPYNTMNIERTLNSDDLWYNYQNAWGYSADLDIALKDENDLYAGVVGSISLGLNLSFSSPEVTHFWWSGNSFPWETAMPVGA